MKKHFAGQQIEVPGRTAIDPVNSTTTYVGEALPGTEDSDNAWLIKRITFNANGDATDIRWANKGESAIWANRASLEYS